MVIFLYSSVLVMTLVKLVNTPTKIVFWKYHSLVNMIQGVCRHICINETHNMVVSVNSVLWWYRVVEWELSPVFFTLMTCTSQ